LRPRAPYAARTGDSTSHGGTIGPPGAPTVLIGNRPAAVVGDTHLCPVPQPHPPSVFPKGSLSVTIGGRGALRVDDTAGCGANIVLGEWSVVIGD
jgi:uncharacterized Zn-binding protein involved in type VI secretion